MNISQICYISCEGVLRPVSVIQTGQYIQPYYPQYQQTSQYAYTQPAQQYQPKYQQPSQYAQPAPQYQYQQPSQYAQAAQQYQYQRPSQYAQPAQQYQYQQPSQYAQPAIQPDFKGHLQDPQPRGDVLQMVRPARGVGSVENYKVEKRKKRIEKARKVRIREREKRKAKRHESKRPKSLAAFDSLPRQAPPSPPPPPPPPPKESIPQKTEKKETREEKAALKLPDGVAVNRALNDESKFPFAGVMDLPTADHVSRDTKAVYIKVFNFDCLKF